MSQEATQEYIELMRKKYREAVKFKKIWILDQVCEVCGFTRDHARKVLTNRSRIRKQRPGPQRKYGGLVCKHVINLWVKMGYMCSKRMKAALPMWLPHYEEIDFTQEVRKQLLEVSSATIDRIVAPFRRQHQKGISSTRSNHSLKNTIPLKLLGEIHFKPGHVEADTVAHCGTSLFGEFIYSLTVTDLATGWTENRATWNKRATDILNQIQDIERTIPFDLVGFSSDNGGEFLNLGLIQYFKDPSRTSLVEMTRGRAYRKNDNPHVEQKNFTHVRQLFGYHRFDRKEYVDLMNEIYKKYWNPLRNYFHPSIKLVKKERVGSKIKKTYDDPQAPYLRLLRSPFVSAKHKKRIREEFKKLDPFALQNLLAQSINHLNELYRKSQEGLVA